MSLFKPAERKRVFLKIGMMGPSGAGKTYSAILLGSGLGTKIALLDTENGSGELYSHLTPYDVAALEPPFNPKKYISAIREAEQAGYEVLIIDSLSHAWKEILSMKESFDKSGGNSFTNWGKVKPLYDELKETILHSHLHIIACMRAKDEYVIEKNSYGKDAPKKVGMGAIAEPGSEYEFTTVFDVLMSHDAQASKDRTGLFDGELSRITPEHGKRLLAWLDGGVVAPEPKPEVIVYNTAKPVEPEPVPYETPRNDTQRTINAQAPVEPSKGKARYFAILNEMKWPDHEKSKAMYHEIWGKVLKTTVTSGAKLTAPQWNTLADWIAKVQDGTATTPKPITEMMSKTAAA